MGSFVIVLREGFEATLIVGLILGVLNKTGQRQHVRAVWWGVGAGLVTSVVIGAILFAAVGELSGRAEQLYEGTAMLLAAALVTWMVFWMRKQARTLGGHLRSQVSTALVAGGGLALASVAFVGVTREGLESALFLFASVGDSGVLQTVVAGTLGFVAAVVIGVLFYKGSIRMDLRRFFMVTGVLVIGFAAYLLAGGLHEFGEAGGSQFLEEGGAIIAVLYGVGLAAFYLRSNPPKPETAPQAAPAAKPVEPKREAEPVNA